jgi:hypothetical protein
LEECLEVYTAEKFPTQWADCHNAVATSCAEAGSSVDPWHGETSAEALEREALLALATDHYAFALEVYKRDAFPGEWAMVTANLATSHRDGATLLLARSKKSLVALEAGGGGDGDSWDALAAAKAVADEASSRMEAAIRHYQEALEVFTEEAWPEQWALIQNNLAEAFAERVAGDRQDNLEKSQEHFESALGAMRLRRLSGEPSSFKPGSQAMMLSVKRDPTPSISPFRHDRDAHRTAPMLPEGARALDQANRRADRKGGSFQSNGRGRPGPIDTSTGKLGTLPHPSPPGHTRPGAPRNTFDGASGLDTDSAFGGDTAQDQVSSVTTGVVIPPGAQAGDVLYTAGPDGVTYAFPVPRGAGPGTLVEFTVPVHHAASAGPAPASLAWPPKNLPTRRPPTAPPSDKPSCDKLPPAGRPPPGPHPLLASMSSIGSMPSLMDDPDAPTGPLSFESPRPHSPNVEVSLPDCLQRQLSLDSMPSLLSQQTSRRVSPDHSPERRSPERHAHSPRGDVPSFEVLPTPPAPPSAAPPSAPATPKARAPPRSPRPGQPSLQKQLSASSLVSDNPYLE